MIKHDFYYYVGTKLLQNAEHVIARKSVATQLQKITHTHVKEITPRGITILTNSITRDIAKKNLVKPSSRATFVYVFDEKKKHILTFVFEWTPEIIDHFPV